MGLLEIDTSYKASFISLAQFILSSKDITVMLIKQHQQQLPRRTSLIRMAEAFSDSTLMDEEVKDGLKEAGRLRRNDGGLRR